MLHVLPFATLCALTPEEQATAVIDELNSLNAKRDIGAIASLLTDDCLILMTDPTAPTPHPRFFTKKRYLDLLVERYRETGHRKFRRVVRSVSVESPAILVAADTEERARIGDRSEWIRGREYIFLAAENGKLKIKMVLAEQMFYVPDVPPDTD